MFVSGKRMKIAQEKNDIRKRYVECLERSEQSEKGTSVTISKEAIDVELAGFNALVNAHLKTLSSIARLKAQQDILKVITEAMLNDE